MVMASMQMRECDYINSLWLAFGPNFSNRREAVCVSRYDLYGGTTDAVLRVSCLCNPGNDAFNKLLPLPDFPMWSLLSISRTSLGPATLGRSGLGRTGPDLLKEVSTWVDV